MIHLFVQCINKTVSVPKSNIADFIKFGISLDSLSNTPEFTFSNLTKDTLFIDAPERIGPGISPVLIKQNGNPFPGYKIHFLWKKSRDTVMILPQGNYQDTFKDLDLCFQFKEKQKYTLYFAYFGKVYNSSKQVVVEYSELLSDSLFITK
jgi:hypothetical protein